MTSGAKCAAPAKDGKLLALWDEYIATAWRARGAQEKTDNAMEAAHAEMPEIPAEIRFKTPSGDYHYLSPISIISNAQQRINEMIDQGVAPVDAAQAVLDQIDASRRYERARAKVYERHGFNAAAEAVGDLYHQERAILDQIDKVQAKTPLDIQVKIMALCAHLNGFDDPGSLVLTAGELLPLLKDMEHVTGRRLRHDSDAEWKADREGAI